MVKLLYTHSVQVFIRRRMQKSPGTGGSKAIEIQNEKESEVVKMLNQEIMWLDAFWQRSPLYIAVRKHCMKKTILKSPAR